MSRRSCAILLAVALQLSACATPAETPTPSAVGPSIADRVRLFADRTQLRLGECTALHWEVPADLAPAIRVIVDDRAVDPIGEMEVCPEGTRVYGIAVDTGGELIGRSVEIVVVPPDDGGPEPGPVEPGSPAYEGGSWQATGGPPGGLGYDIRMDPRNPDVMYVTDAWAGAFKSIDGGATWFPINDGITARTGPSGDAIPVFSLTIDPNDPDTIWAGTQFGGGAFRSDDGGESWQELSAGLREPSLSIRGFTVEPGNSDVVYLAGEVSSWDWNGSPLPGLGLDMTKGVVYRSTNRGRSWTRIWSGDNLARYVWIHPNDHRLLYVSTGIFDREAANSDPQAPDPGGVGVLRSRDGGATWQALGTTNGFRPDELYIGSLFMHPQDPRILIAATGNDPYQTRLGRPLGAIYLTRDGGDRWQRVLELSNASTVEICTSDPRVMYAGSINGVHRSDDGGETWLEVAGSLWGSEDVLAGFPIDMQCDPRDPMRIFVNNYIGGNFLSVDGGRTWTTASRGYTGALLRQVDTARPDSDTLYAAGRMGTFVTHDGGATWHGTAYGPARVPEGIVVAVDPFDATHVMAVLQDGGPNPKASRDGGSTWHNVDTGLWPPGEFRGGTVTRIAFSRHERGLALATAGTMDCYVARETCDAGDAGQGGGIIRSTDGGETWAPTDLDVGQVFDLHLVDASLAYAVAYPASVYRSTDGGQHWQRVAERISDAIPGTFIDRSFPLPIPISVAADPADPSRVYAGFERGGVMVSEDGGVTWGHAPAGMEPETTIVDIEVDPAHPGVLYLASPTSGIFYSATGGEPWLPLNDELATRAAVDLALSADGSRLTVATNGGGVWRMGP